MKRVLFLLALVLSAASCSTGDPTSTDTGSADATTSSAPISTTPPGSGNGSEGDIPAVGPDGDDGTTSADSDAVLAGVMANPDSLRWTVIAVEAGDTLNVRADPDPNSDIVGELAPWATDLNIGDLVDQNSNGSWRSIELDDGTQGWVNARFLVAQPDELSADEQAELAERTLCFVQWARGDTVGEGCGDWLAERALWVGGIGIYADAPATWNWFPSNALDNPSAWSEVRTFELGPAFGAIDCGSDCDKSLIEFLNLDRIDDTTTPLFDDIVGENQAYLDGALWEAPDTLHRVVLYTPASDPDSVLDWQRLHIVHDWSTGEPRIILINNHGWTP